MTKRTNEPQAVELAAPVVEPVPAAPVAEVAQEDDGEPTGAAFEPVAVPKFEMPREAVRRRYWVGLKDAPFAHYDVKGVGFTRFAGAPPVDDDGTFNAAKIQRIGQFIMLTDDQVAAIRSKILDEVFARETRVSDSISPKGERRSTDIAQSVLMRRSVYDPRAGKATEIPNAPGENWEYRGHFMFCLPCDGPEVKRLQRAFPESWLRNVAAVETLPSLVASRFVIPREPIAQAA